MMGIFRSRSRSPKPPSRPRGNQGREACVRHMRCISTGTPKDGFFRLYIVPKRIPMIECVCESSPCFRVRWGWQ